MPYEIFDRSKLVLKPLAERKSDMSLADLLPLDADVPRFGDPNLYVLAERMGRARRSGRQVILMMGAHVIKRGLSWFVVDAIRRGLVTHVAVNGACAIHDMELALIGATTESVARYIRTGEFGMWVETGKVNEAAAQAAREGIGLGEAVGRMIAGGAFPHRDVSILASAFEAGIPATVHVGIGQDIVHQHPNCDGSALGLATYTDFLVFAASVAKLEGGVFLNYGTAVMGPEVYLKALSMARNVARQEGREIRHFTTAVFDLHDLGDYSKEAPKDDPRYYYRPYKTVLVRTVQDGGESFYIRGDHRDTMPCLFRAALEAMAGNG
ncbi:MAG: hypothetical protein ACUVTZ_12905 [Armatimonadota bacterium]